MPRTSGATRLSSAETLVKNVRLLELDEEFDWPGITLDTFSSSSPVQEQQRRSYAAQWLLYKLFLSWDPAWTKATLHDLFPPLEPKQVGELRLRIYKQLTLLKRDGVFANDLFLRRTMFDDCKGPKFEDLLAAFSSQVLQREVCQAGYEGSRVRKMARGEIPLGSAQKVPLTLAYQSAFHKILGERKVSEQRWQTLGLTIAAREAELHAMSAQLEFIISQRQEKRIPKRTLDRLRSTVQVNWVGDPEWAEITLQSDQHRPQRTFLERPFSEVWTHACNDSLDMIRPKRNDSLLEELRLRVQRQNKRLDKWRSLRAALDAQEQDASSQEHDADTAVNEVSVPETPLVNRSLETPQSTSQAKRPRSDSLTISDADAMAPEDDDEALNEPIASYGQLYSSPVAQMHADESLTESPGDVLADQIIASIANAAPTPMKVPLTLAERTRLSMARLTPSKGHSPVRGADGRVTTQLARAEPITKSQLSPGSPGSAGQYASLAERTRKSMSHMKAGPQAKARKSRVSRVSNVYPINQFESPNRMGYGPAESPNTSHLEEKLDAMGADETLAFRSRPLLAHSPSLGPQPDAIEEDAKDLEELEEPEEDFS